MVQFLSRFRTDESGATAIEYGLIVALVFVVALTALQAFGSAGSGVMNRAMEAVKNAIAGKL